MSGYVLWRLQVPGELEELVTAELWQRGSLGIETRDGDAGLLVEAYFPDPPPPEARAFDAAGWSRRGVERLEMRTVEDRDWLASYRAGLEPFDVGAGFRVDPRLPAVPGRTPATREQDGRRVLRIPAQTAFGTGSHESTRLAVRWLEELDVAGRDVLDVGAGSGILSFVAGLLGARRAVGFDRDLQAVFIARRNRRWNGRDAAFFAGRLSALRPGPRFDLAVVNVLPDHILDELPRLVGLLRPGAQVVSSGNLVARSDELGERFAAAGLRVVGEKRENEWTAFLLRTGDA